MRVVRARCGSYGDLMDICRSAPSVAARATATVAALALLVAAAAACSEETPRTRVRVGYLASTADLPWFVLDQGLAETGSFDLFLHRYEGGRPLLEGLASGEIDVGMPGIVPLMGVLDVIPEEVVVLAAGGFADADHPSGAFLVSSAVRTWDDLDGAAVGVNTLGSIGHAAMTIRLSNEAVEGISFEEIPFPNMGLAVAGGNISGALMFEPFITQSLARGDGHVLDWVIGRGAPFERFIVSVLAVTTAFRDAVGTALPELLGLYLDALGWIEGHQAQSRDVLRRALSLSPAVASSMTFPAYVMDGSMDEALWDEIQAKLVDGGVIETPTPLGDVYDPEPLERARAG